MMIRFDKLVVLGLGVMALTANLCAATYGTGDVFASKNGSVLEYSPTGVFQQSLTSGISGFTTGAAFDASGTLHVTDFSTNQVITFANNAGNTQGTFGSGYSTPEDIRIDGAGNVFVTNIGGAGLLKFNSAGALLASYAVGQRIDWFDLNSSETKMYYTDEGGIVHTWDLGSNTAGAPVCTGCGNYALRLLGDGTLLVAASAQVNRVRLSDGAIVDSYGVTGVGAFFALNLDPNGTSFWTGSFQNDNIYRFNIGSAGMDTQTISFNSGSGGSSLYGLSVFGEITQTNQDQVPEPASVILLGTLLFGLSVGLKRRLRAS